MESVNVREFKSHLSEYLHAIQQGKTVLITARGKPVARLVPVTALKESILPAELEQRMWDLVVEGFLTWSGQPVHLPDPVATNRGFVQLSDLVVEDRE